MDTREHRWAEAMRAERRGDRAAYERLLGEITPVLRGLVRHRLSLLGLNAAEAEDLVQEALIGLHTKRHTWSPDRPFLPWLHAIARYKLLDGARRLRREARQRIEISLDDLAEVMADPDAEVDRSPIHMERQLATLSPGQRDVVEALALDGESVRTTAQRLDTSEGAIRVTFHRALRKLMAAADPGEAPKGK
ncbi:RNA polymerase sigma factor [Azorhizobium oxalatiphilum]|uniref:RNA polymerase sigma factor n=1 Tax=Azorhizobium oxalatiphilum TaxID=980631 RepID=A0A917FJ96_9HYPH|nr:sigma-70 family RNA polymerase sigma factor [Azorhizobium oxalatiphilum]GGF83945.1 RNA polymerase sigma factor [Azorhizobium oxalatiphilum]